MISSAELFFEDENDSGRNTTYMCRLRKSIRDSSNPLELPERIFVSYFRLNKQTFLIVLDKIKHKLQSTRTSAIPPILKLACVLRFFADGSYQKGVGNEFDLGLAQPTVSVVLSEVLNIFETELCPIWIRTELTENEKQEARRYFFTRTRIPGIIGCVDGTHIGIVAPAQLPHQYLNRKGFYSLNTMIACDHNMVIRYVDGRYPGSTHDSFVWNCSELKSILERLYRNSERSSMYLGDSGYPLLPYLLTPFRNTTSGSREALFKKQHAKARNIVERTIGVLKSRFRCLLNERKLHYAPKKATKIINACCVLHNICKNYNVSEPELIYPIEVAIANETAESGTNNNTQEGDLRRIEILNSL